MGPVKWGLTLPLVEREEGEGREREIKRDKTRREFSDVLASRVLST